jgi:hypothetical protein
MAFSMTYAGKILRPNTEPAPRGFFPTLLLFSDSNFDHRPDQSSREGSRRGDVIWKVRGSEKKEG